MLPGPPPCHLCNLPCTAQSESVRICIWRFRIHWCSSLSVFQSTESSRCVATTLQQAKRSSPHLLHALVDSCKLIQPRAFAHQQHSQGTHILCSSWYGRDVYHSGHSERRHHQAPPDSSLHLVYSTYSHQGTSCLSHRDPFPWQGQKTSGSGRKEGIPLCALVRTDDYVADKFQRTRR